MPIRRMSVWAGLVLLWATPAPGSLLTGGDFEDLTAVSPDDYWAGSKSLGMWIATGGLPVIDDSGFLTVEAKRFDSSPEKTGGWRIVSDADGHYARGLRTNGDLGQYVEARDVTGPLTLAFDYIHTGGALSVEVRGVGTLPEPGSLESGFRAYKAWADSGTELFDTRNLAKSKDWTHVEATFDVPQSYPYYFVSVQQEGGGSSTVDHGIDNVTLTPEPGALVLALAGALSCFCLTRRRA